MGEFNVYAMEIIDLVQSNAKKKKRKSFESLKLWIMFLFYSHQIKEAI